MAIITGSADKGGTAAKQAEALPNAIADLEAKVGKRKLNGKVQIHEADGKVYAIGITSDEAKEDKPKKRGK